MEDSWFIGEVVRQTGASEKAIRSYEKLGLLPVLERTEKGYRIYRSIHIERIQLIRQAMALGFSIKNISSVLDHTNIKCEDFPWDRLMEMITRRREENLKEIARLQENNLQLEGLLRAFQKKHSIA